jgi:hypothetical protein
MYVFRGFLSINSSPNGHTIVLIDIDLVSRTGGMRALLQALVDGPVEIAPIIASAFLYIVDAPRTRAYLRPGFELEVECLIAVLGYR